ncbi:alpha/beta hydrolase family protein [Sorangium sp. So ce1000]|uniref:alpha/beta hydrolase family protein n=1 Tax=Sorangium sp. So ce1000 TaxID=3133325 RepID=UPI003F5FC04C
MLHSNAARHALCLLASLSASALLAGCGDNEALPPHEGDPTCTGWGDEAPADGVLDLPRPTGPHPVGTQIRALTDSARGEEATEDPDDRRELMVQLWYPADPCGTGQLAPYLSPEEGDSRRTSGDLPLEDGFEARIHTHARVGVPLADDGAPHPVLLFSHGFGLLRADYTSLLEDLASHGFVVAAISHTYDTELTVFPDGRAVPFGSVVRTPAMDASPEEIEAFTQAMGEHVTVWVDDARFVLDELTAAAQDDPDGLLTGQLDLERVGVLGHSYGGAMAAEACARDDRFDAGLDIDGSLVGPKNGAGSRSIAQPFFILLASTHPDDATIDETYGAVAGQAYRAQVEGTAHLTFSDLPVVVEHFLGKDAAPDLLGTLDPARAVEITNAYTRAFVKAHVSGEAAPLLDGPSPDYPEVAFEKKP